MRVDVQGSEMYEMLNILYQGLLCIFKAKSRHFVKQYKDPKEEIFHILKSNHHFIFIVSKLDEMKTREMVAKEMKIW